MPELSFLLSRLEKSCRIPIRVWDRNNNILYFAGEISDPKQKDMLQQQAGSGFQNLQDIPLVMMGTDGIYGIVFRDAEENIFYMGPACTNGLTFRQQAAFRRRHEIKDFIVDIPTVSLSNALNDAILLYGIITGREVTEHEIMQASGMDDERIQESERVLEYEIRTSNRERHLGYKEEQKWLGSIENGTLQRTKTDLNAENLEKLNQVGTLASGNTLKQYEYLAVSSTVLATRAAIRGGVSTYDAYHMSELYLQKISRCSDAMGYLEIQRDMALDFAEQVRKIKENKNSDCVEQCKNYIAGHRKDKFSLAAVAEAVGRSSGYLSRIFSEETGQTMQEYALDLKLDAAANLLIHSKETIGDIAEYLNFSTQSYFGERFKAKYGMTPAAYRRENRIQDF